MVYPSLRQVTDSLGTRRRPELGRRSRVPATVVLLGLTSMFTDISSEMVTAVLPVYLTIELSFTALQFGLYEGLANGVQAVVRIGGGAAADRRSGHKGLALIGYGSSAVTRIAILFTGGAFAPTTGVLLADRAGKGVRTAPRDAMISLASPPDALARSFGVHRTLDSIGALIGPLVAFGVLAAFPRSYDTVFVVAFSFALIGVAILALFVPPWRPASPPSERFRRALLRDVVASRPLRRVLAGATLLGALMIGDAFIFLGFRRSAEFGLEFFPLLFTGTALVFLTLAVPVGRLADRIGRRHVYVGGYGVLGLLYVVLLDPPSGALGIATVVGALGLFYAATDGVLMAAATEILGERTRATGLAVVATGTAFGRLAAAIAFGALWTMSGPRTAFACFAVVAPIAMVVAWRLMSVVPPGGDA